MAPSRGYPALSLWIVLTAVAACACGSQCPELAEPAAASPSPVARSQTEPQPPTNIGGYDPAYAERLGADDYGMASYVIAFLKAGPTRPESKDEAAELMRGHLANIRRLAEAGKLLVAGPFRDQGELRGIYIFDVESIDEARALTETDPAIEAGSLVMELRPWYGSAALREVNAIHERIAKQNP